MLAQLPLSTVPAREPGEALIPIVLVVAPAPRRSICQTGTSESDAEQPQSHAEDADSAPSLSVTLLEALVYPLSMQDNGRNLHCVA